MRTTLTLDDEIAAALKKKAFESGKSFKEVVNETLRSGLRAPEQPKRKPYKLTPRPMGSPTAGLQLDKALQLAAMLEDEEIRRELELRK